VFGAIGLHVSPPSERELLNFFLEAASLGSSRFLFTGMTPYLGHRSA
jgi:hypothetical protein